MPATVRLSPAPPSNLARDAPTALAGAAAGSASVVAGLVVVEAAPLSLAAQAGGKERLKASMAAHRLKPSPACAVRLSLLFTDKRRLAFDRHLRAAPSAAAHALGIAPGDGQPGGIAHRQ